MAAAPEEEEVPPEPVPTLPDDALPAREALLEEVFRSCTYVHPNKAKLESLKERQAKVEAAEMDATKMKGLTYGELNIKELHEVLNIIKRDHGPLFPKQGIFLDLGSGAGKACIAAGMLHPFEKVVGVEVLGALGDMATSALGKINEGIELPEGVELPAGYIEFVRGDFEADFANTVEPLAPKVVVAVAVATSFGPEQLQAMAKLAEKMPDNAIFVTYTQGLPESVLDQRNWYPDQRKAVLVKKKLAKRGVDPDTVVIPELPVEDPVGWVQIRKDTVTTDWGQTTRFFFKREPFKPPVAAVAPEAGGA